MMLLLDVGNTFMKWACFEGDAFVDEGEILHVDEALDEVFADAWEDLPVPTAVHVANVAGDEFAAALDDWLEETWNVSAYYAQSSEEDYGVRNAYEQAETLGVDRWLAIIAAWNQQRAPVCVIDCGTALTVDAVDEKGQHLGGLIVPGLGMMKDCLLEGTEGIDFEAGNPVESADSLLAHDTRGGVEVGALYTMLALIDRITNDLERELGEDMQCILTGGDAPDIVSLLGRDVLHRPQLVLEGLALKVIGRDGV